MTRLEIYRKLKTRWPGLLLAWPAQPGSVWLTDNEYDCPAQNDVNRIIHWQPPWKFWVKPGYRAEWHDCDDFSMRNAYEVRQAYSGKHPLAFGIVDCTQCRYATKNHSLNLLVCQEDILMYDWQIDRVWTADPETDKPYFIRI